MLMVFHTLYTLSLSLSLSLLCALCFCACVCLIKTTMMIKMTTTTTRRSFFFSPNNTNTTNNTTKKGTTQRGRVQQKESYIVKRKGRPLNTTFITARSTSEKTTTSNNNDGRSNTNNNDFVRLEEVTHVPPGSGSRAVVSSMNVGFPKCGLVVLVGRSGAGKTTLLHLIAGLSEPTSGEIFISSSSDENNNNNNEEEDEEDEEEMMMMQHPDVSSKRSSSVAANADAKNFDDEKRRRRRRGTPAVERTKRVGLCFQFPERHFLGRTILEELTFGWPQNAKSFRMRRDLAETTKKALRAVDMQEYPLESEVKTLSGGYKRRLALACQLARNPKVLCLDEPLAGLDWKSRSDVAKVLGKLKRERLILVVTHDVEEMKRIADFAYRVKDNGKGIEEEIGLAEGFGANTDLLEDDALKSEFSEFT
jgi:energy-coupling factor transporter ATP-binding protein EcfA2